MHLAVAYELERKLSISDKNRVEIGQILPDAVLSVDKKALNSHFIELFDGGKRKHFDFYGFFGRFKDEVMSDELYLGYYFHLIEDNLFRYYLYYIKGLLSRRGDTELTARLYMDYHILNRKLVEKYGFENKPAVPENFAEEKINSIYPFEIEEFLQDMQEDFSEKHEGKPKLIAFRSLEKDFINGCVKICAAEYDVLQRGKHLLAKYDLSWKINL